MRSDTPIFFISVTNFIGEDSESVEPNMMFVRQKALISTTGHRVKVGVHQHPRLLFYRHNKKNVAKTA